MSIGLFKNSKVKQTYEPGQVLFAAGTKGDVMYGVVEGEIEIVAPGGAVIEVAVPGMVIGELALIDDEPRAASAVARTTCVVAPLDRSRFLYLVQEHPTFALDVMQLLAARLRRQRH